MKGLYQFQYILFCVAAM